MVAKGVNGWDVGPAAQTIAVTDLGNKISAGTAVIMPDEDVSHTIADKYLTGRTINYDPIFLRWDRQRSAAEDKVSPDHLVSEEQLAKELLLQASEAGKSSSNIWRRVGAVLVKDSKVLGQASNRHQPTDHTPWIDGDVRMNYGRGIGIEMTTDMHAEPILIGDAARKGEALNGADLYVTTFPCPPCAMLIAHSGIKRLFYAEGYAVLDGERVLKANNVELIKVNVELPPDRADIYRPYPEN
nr:Cytidine and deoxycytidylate deaminase zinc-binding region [uncultured bacterium]